ncbi:hypothetical protein BTJ44_02888 [Bacillus mycoides]|nr:hypothetical protein BTJ44_02888 [Bacillus mycoides]
MMVRLKYLQYGNMIVMNSIKKLNQKLEATRYMLKEYMIGMKNMAGKNMFYRSTY